MDETGALNLYYSCRSFVPVNAVSYLSFASVPHHCIVAWLSQWTFYMTKFISICLVSSSMHGKLVFWHRLLDSLNKRHFYILYRNNSLALRLTLHVPCQQEGGDCVLTCCIISHIMKMQQMCLNWKKMENDNRAPVM